MSKGLQIVARARKPATGSEKYRLRGAVNFCHAKHCGNEIRQAWEVYVISNEQRTPNVTLIIVVDLMCQ